jgi:hypothetical protein
MSCDEALLAILFFFALAQPTSACRRFSIWHYDVPPTLSDRSPGRPSRACAITPKLPLPALKCRTASRVWQKTMAVGDSTRAQQIHHRRLALLRVDAPKRYQITI